MNIVQPHTNLKKLVLIMLLADVMIALQGASVKLAAEFFTTNYIAFIRFALNLLFFLLVLALKRRPLLPLFRAHSWKNHAIRSIGGVLGIYGCYLGLVYMPISPATLIFFSFPVFTPIVTRLWLKIQIPARLWIGLGVTFLGLIFVLNPGAGLFNPYAVIPLVGAIIAAIAGVAVRQLHYTDTTDSIMLYFFLTGVVVAGVLQLILPESHPQIFTVKSIIFLICVGFFATAFQWLYTLAARYGPARLLSPFLYLSFIFTTIEDFIIWKIPLHLGTIIGFFLLVVGTLLFIWLYPRSQTETSLEDK